MRSASRANGASSQATAPSRGISARLDGSTAVPPPVATTTPRAGQQVDQRLALERAEVGLARLPEDAWRCRAARSRSMPRVDVLEAPVEAPGQRPAHRGLAGAHEPHQVDLVGLHARSLSSVSKKPGNDTAATSAPWMSVGPVGAERRHGKAHGQAMVVTGVDGAAGQPPRAAHGEAVGILVGVGAHGAQPVDQRRDAVALLHAQLAGAAHLDRAAEGGQRRQRRQLVDEQRHLGRA